MSNSAMHQVADRRSVREGDLLWTPSVERSRLTAFTRFAEDRTSRTFAEYTALWQWSTTELEEFWQAVWDFVDVRSSVRAPRCSRAAGVTRTAPGTGPATSTPSRGCGGTASSSRSTSAGAASSAAAPTPCSTGRGCGSAPRRSTASSRTTPPSRPRWWSTWTCPAAGSSCRCSSSSLGAELDGEMDARLRRRLLLGADPVAVADPSAMADTNALTEFVEYARTQRDYSLA